MSRSRIEQAIADMCEHLDRIEGERQRFEAWAVEHIVGHNAKRVGVTYQSPIMDAAWAAWTGAQGITV